MAPPKKDTNHPHRHHHRRPRQYEAPPDPRYADTQDDEFDDDDQGAPPPPPNSYTNSQAGNPWSLGGSNDLDYPPQNIASTSRITKFTTQGTAHQQSGYYDDRRPTYTSGVFTQSPAQMYNDNAAGEDTSSTQARKGSNDSRTDCLQDQYPSTASSYDRTQERFDDGYYTGSQGASNTNYNNSSGMGRSTQARDSNAFMPDVPRGRSSTSAAGATTNATQNPNRATNPNWGQGDRRNSFQDFQKPFPSKAGARPYPSTISEIDSNNCLRYSGGGSGGVDSVPRSYQYPQYPALTGVGSSINPFSTPIGLGISGVPEMPGGGYPTQLEFGDDGGDYEDDYEKEYTIKKKKKKGGYKGPYNGGYK